MDAEHDVKARVDTLENKIDVLSASVDRRFDAVDAALVEQRAYTDFAYERLETKMDAGFARIETKLTRTDTKMDAGFARVTVLESAVARIERKVDQIIDLHLQKTPPGSSEAPQ